MRQAPEPVATHFSPEWVLLFSISLFIFLKFFTSRHLSGVLENRVWGQEGGVSGFIFLVFLIDSRSSL